MDWRHPKEGCKRPRGWLKTATVNRHLKQWGLDWRTFRREPPAVRFQAQHSNELWQFDISSSDLKQLKAPAWIDVTKGPPTLMLYSVVDDRSGVAYQEYHCAYGEDVEAARKFLFNTMAPKADARFPFSPSAKHRAKFPLASLPLTYTEGRGEPELLHDRLGDLIETQFIMAETIDVLGFVWGEPRNNLRRDGVAFIDQFL